MILYGQHGGTSVRLVYTVMPAPIAGKKSTEKQGGQLKGDNKKPIVAMAPHPSGAALCNHPYFIVSYSLLILQVLSLGAVYSWLFQTHIESHSSGGVLGVLWIVRQS